MSNATLLKYTNIYGANRRRNEIFDEWLSNNYEIKVGKHVWDYGTETFVSKANGETVYVEAIIMREYVKAKMPYFRDLDHFDEWLNSSYATQKEFFGR